MAAPRTLGGVVAVTDAATPEAHDPTLRPHGRGPSPQLRLVIAVVLACALVGAVVWGVLQTLSQNRAADSAAPGSAGQSATAQQQDRRDVQLAVSSFVANLNNYSLSDIAGYKERLTPLLTSGFAKSFDIAVEGIVTEVKATKMTSVGSVVQTAVSSIDSDNATALVVADAHVTSALGERERHFRWKVSVVQQGGDWLIDDFQPVE